MKPFDPFTLPVTATSLIEASAGTGKTFGIAALFVRWVLLEKKSVTRLLVLTFTKAATAELKSRLRARLTQILRLLQQRDAVKNIQEIADDAFLQELFVRLDAGDEPRERLLLRLRTALDEFDGAGIYTIHSFCRSVLRDEAFLCGVPFAVEQVENQDSLIERCRDDFWRREVAVDAERAQLCFEAALTPDKALTDIKSYLSKPYLHYDIPPLRWRAAREAVETQLAALTPLLVARLSPVEANELSGRVIAALSAGTRASFAEPWRAQMAQNGISGAEAAFWQIFPCLNHKIYQAPTFAKLFTALRAADGPATLARELLPKLLLLHADNLAKGTKGKAVLSAEEIAAVAPLAALGQVCADEADERDHALSAIRFALLRHIDHGLAEEKRHSKRRSYDDLLLDVHHALTASPHRVRLCRRLAASWDVLMVDEFQDTDPIQYAIFKTAFAAEGVPVYLVGDPKQSIYRFRGADIFTCLQAAQDAGEQRYTLDVNWRSHKALVAAVGALFSRDAPFVHELIDYPSVRAEHQHSRLSPALKAMTVFCLNTAQEKIKVEAKRSRAADVCADHLAQVLNHAAAGDLMLRERALSAGDVAVLVRSHHEAQYVMKALKRRNIDSVSIRRESIFASEEAFALAALLRFWLNPQQTDHFRFVLAGALFQYTAADIAALNRDDAAISRHIEMARHALTLWQEVGLFSAYQYFNRETCLEQRLIRRRAERTLTNLFQLLELLAAAADECFGERALLAWLDTEIEAASAQRGDYALLRLENDEALVKIITVHKSKGLQYPLVYCPFLSHVGQHDERIKKVRCDEITVLRDKTRLNKDEDAALHREYLSEALRLLYVALTRAAEAVVLCVTDAEKLTPHKLPLDYLLSAYADGNTSAWTAWQAWAAAATLPDAIELSTVLPDFTVFRAPAAAAVSFQAEPLPERNFTARRFSSFSAWARGAEEARRQNDEELFWVDDGERQAVSVADAATVLDAHAFPGGIRAGLCWHDILQVFDFARPASEQQALMTRHLDAYGFDAEAWCDALTPLFEHTRLAQLNLNPSRALADIPRRRRLSESTFLLDELRFDARAVLRHFGEELPSVIADALRRVSAQTLRGFFNGFIDMTAQDDEGRIYLIDYKSNRLGDNATAYTRAAMDEAMAQHHYVVQALLYALAIRRQLALRGVTPSVLHIRYLFLRGLTAHGENGIWSWDLDCGKLTALDAALSDIH